MSSPSLPLVIHVPLLVHYSRQLSILLVWQGFPKSSNLDAHFIHFLQDWFCSNTYKDRLFYQIRKKKILDVRENTHRIHPPEPLQQRTNTTSQVCILVQWNDNQQLRSSRAHLDFGFDIWTYIRSLKQASQQKIPLLQLFCVRLTHIFW